MKKIITVKPEKVLPRVWDQAEWVPIHGRPGWFENPKRPNADGSRPKMYSPPLFY